MPGGSSQYGPPSLSSPVTAAGTYAPANSQLKPTAVKSTNYTAVAGDYVPTSGNPTITMPLAATAGLGGIVAVKQIASSGTFATIAASGADVFNVAGVVSFSVIANFEQFSLISDGVATWYVETSLSKGGLDTLYVAPNELAWDGPTGAIAQTFPRILTASGSGTVLSTGRLSLAAVHLHANQVVTNIGFLSAATALSVGTNQWFALYSSALALLGVTSDDTSTAWGANTAKTLALAAAYTAPTTGLYYLGINVTATVVPTLRCYTGSSTSTGLSPKTEGTSNSGLTNPASAPNPATSPTVTGTTPYAWVT